MEPKIRRTLKNKNKRGDKGHIIGDRYFKMYEIPVTKMVCGHVERMQDQRMSKEIATYTMKGTRKRRRPRKRWRDKVEQDLNYGTKNKTGRQWREIVGNGLRLYGKPRSTTDWRA
jgi:hypothetical protein